MWWMPATFEEDSEELMPTRVLVPLDGSRLAEQALPCAKMLGQGLPAEMVLFRAVSIPLDVQDVLKEDMLKAGGLMSQLEAEANEYLDGIADALRKTGMNASHAVQYGPAAEAIVDYANQEAIQLIVMATHGYTGIERWTHGSVAERVLQSASVPVLMGCGLRGGLSTGEDVRQCGRILVPLDGSTTAEQVLPPVSSIARALDAEMVLLRVSIVHMVGSLVGEWIQPLEGDFSTADQLARGYLDRVAGRLEEQGIQVSTTVQMGAVAESIVEYAQSERVDMIAMCTHGRTGLKRWAMGSVADRVLRAGGIPILLVRAR
jgi:nucleotide-binding universal stress UspA family protein